jgi:type III restriction enzyme
MAMDYQQQHHADNAGGLAGPVAVQAAGRLTQGQRRAYLAAVVNHQLHGCGVPLVVLAQARFAGARIEAHVADLRDAAAQRSSGNWCWPRAMAGWWSPTGRTRMCSSRAATRRPWLALRGRYQFGKHYFPVLADLKDGGQEFQCAQLIDRHPQVRHWVRNLDTAPAALACPHRAGGSMPTLWPSWWMGAWRCWSSRRAFAA